MITPITIRYADRNGLIASPETLASTYAPATAPITPGMSSRFTNAATTFFIRQWLYAENAVATTSAVCTLAAAGETPNDSSSVVALTP
jgi:hypothetical protein